MQFLIGLAITLGLLAFYVSTRPASFRVTRTRAIKAPSATIYGLIQDFHAWGQWSPWDKLDPTMKRTFSGPESGVGAHYHWVGNSKVGEGSMTIANAVTDARVEIDLEFLKPFAANNKITFAIEPDAEGAQVSWTMDGQNNFMTKAFGLFMNMDTMVGRDFEKGLDAMKTAAETTV